MSDDDRERDQEYWDDVYYYENYLKEEEKSGCAGPRISGAFWIWLIVFIIASNISSGLGEVVLAFGIIMLILCRLGRK